MAKRTKAAVSKTSPAATPRDADPAPGPAADRRLAWLERMRPFRARHDRDVSMEGALQSLERQLREQHNAVGDIIDVWNELAPPAVRDIAIIAGVSQGTLTIAVATSGASYELSRMLRDGLERDMMKRLPARVKRIRVRIATNEG